MPETPADRDYEAHRKYQPRLSGRSAPLVGNAPRRMPEKDLNTINGAPNKRSPVFYWVKVPVVVRLLL